MSEQQRDPAQDADERAARCEPAHSIITALGGPMQVALYIRRYGVPEARAMNRTTVYRWACEKPPMGSGTGGYIPAKHWPALIKAAREQHGMTLTVTDFSPRLADALAAVQEAVS